MNEQVKANLKTIKRKEKKHANIQTYGKQTKKGMKGNNTSNKKIVFKRI